MTFFSARFAPGLPAVPAAPPVRPRILFDSGHNAPELVPTAELAKAAQDVITRDGALLARYFLGQGPLGYLPLRTVLADVLGRNRGVTAAVDEVLVTSGSGQGIDLVNATFLAPGDTVLVEDFTYHGAIRRLRQAGARLVRVATDGHGLRVDALDEVLTGLAAAGVRPKFLYLVPTVQNPTGTVLPMDRRRDLLAVAARHDLMIVEDDCYADLHWGPTRTTALRALAPERVIHIGSLSKILAPALRIGFVVAGAAVLQRLVQSKRDAGTGALDQMIAAEFLATGFGAHLARIVPALHRKMQVMAEAVREEFGTTAEFREPEGGIFLWLRLNGVADTRAFQAAAAAEGITYNPGHEWTADPEAGLERIRLCFALSGEGEIREGVGRLAQLCFEATGLPARGANRLRRPAE